MIRWASVLLLLTYQAAVCHAATVTRSAIATLDTGSLAGTRIVVVFSYDTAQVDPAQDSYVRLNSIDFSLYGASLSRKDLTQGGQAIFHRGELQNLTASFDGVIDQKAQVSNITFGFGGNGIIGYVDLKGRYGKGSFLFGPPVVHSGYVADIRLNPTPDSVPAPGVEIELYSETPFPTRSQAPVLRIGERQYSVSRFVKGDPNSVVFTLTEQQFACAGWADPILIQYGTKPSDEAWYFGNLNKKALTSQVALRPCQPFRPQSR